MSLKSRIRPDIVELSHLRLVVCVSNMFILRIELRANCGGCIVNRTLEETNRFNLLLTRRSLSQLILLNRTHRLTCGRLRKTSLSRIRAKSLLAIICSLESWLLLVLSISTAHSGVPSGLRIILTLSCTPVASKVRSLLRLLLLLLVLSVTPTLIWLWHINCGI